MFSSFCLYNVYYVYNMKGLSLFSGLGGDTLGMEMAGVDVIGYVEMDKIASASHMLNFPNCNPVSSETGDITKIPDDVFESYKGVVDVVFAGFPCQGFSHAGQKRSGDPRNQLFREFVRVVACVQPMYIIGENVKGLLSRKTENDEQCIDIIRDEFKKIGYRIEWKVLSAQYYNVPQKRERLIIIGTQDKNKELVFPVPSQDETTLAGVFENVLEEGLKVYDLNSVPDECIVHVNETTETENIPTHPYLNFINDKDGFLFSFGKRISPNHCEIMDNRKPSKTIICTYGRQPRLLVPVKCQNMYFLRCLTTKELLAIQGFPKEFKLCGSTQQRITQIGNAVPPPLIREVVVALMTT